MDGLQRLKTSGFDLHYRLFNVHGWPKVCNVELKRELNTWVTTCHCEEVLPSKLFAATWETVANGMYYGSKEGEALEIKCKWQCGDDLQVLVIQPQPWPEWKHWFGPEADRAETVGGVRIILNLVKRIEVTEDGRVFLMHFACYAQGVHLNAG